MTAVWRYSKAMSGNEMSVLLAMADYADDDGYCWPSQRATSQKSRVSVPAVKRHIKAATGRGEVEIVRGGHTSPTQREWIGRRGFRPTHLYRITLVDRLYQLSGSNRTELPASEEPAASNLPGANRTEFTDNSVQNERVTPFKTTDLPGSNSLAHIRIETSDQILSEDTSESSAAAALTSDLFEDFRLAWNAIATYPLREAHTFTPKRRRLLRARLNERSIAEWRVIMERIAASAFCRGDNQRGFVASFDWLISSPEPGIKVLEGQYDDFVYVSDAELQTARSRMFQVYGGRCPHEPPCGDDWKVCARKFALSQRAQRATA